MSICFYQESSVSTGGWENLHYAPFLNVLQLLQVKSTTAKLSPDAAAQQIQISYSKDSQTQRNPSVETHSVALRVVL